MEAPTLGSAASREQVPVDIAVANGGGADLVERALEPWRRALVGPDPASTERREVPSIGTSPRSWGRTFVLVRASRTVPPSGGSLRSLDSSSEPTRALRPSDELPPPLVVEPEQPEQDELHEHEGLLAQPVELF